MKEPKDFDCVEMKHEIQKRLRAELEGRNEDEVRREQFEKALQSPVMGPVLRTAMERTAPVGRR